MNLLKQIVTRALHVISPSKSYSKEHTHRLAQETTRRVQLEPGTRAVDGVDLVRYRCTCGDVGDWQPGRDAYDLALLEAVVHVATRCQTSRAK